jgi:Putative DNA-binding domain
VDFVDWCQIVLQNITALTRGSSHLRSLGARDLEVAQSIFGENLFSQPGFYGSPRHEAVHDALETLAAAKLLEQLSYGFKPTDLGRIACDDPTSAWEILCTSPQVLDIDHRAVLHAVNSISPQPSDGFAVLAWADRDKLMSELGPAYSAELIFRVGQELEKYELVRQIVGAGLQKLDIRATYHGLVWETKRGFVGESRAIDKLVAEWETTSVDFKREMHTDTPDQKAELIKDLIALANTKASGEHLLVIGFDPKTRTYFGPPDPKLTQDHLEQLASAYTEPIVSLRFTKVPYRSGIVGKFEVVRDPEKLPYKVAKQVGGKKRIDVGQIFVRHGSQVEEPTPAELQALIDEGNRARGNAPTSS